MMDDRNLEK